MHVYQIYLDDIS